MSGKYPKQLVISSAENYSWGTLGTWFGKTSAELSRAATKQVRIADLNYIGFSFLGPSEIRKFIDIKVHCFVIYISKLSPESLYYALYYYIEYL